MFVALLLALQAEEPVQGYNLAVLPVSFSDQACSEPTLFDDLQRFYGAASGGAFTLAGKTYGPIRLGATREEVGKHKIRSAEERAALLRVVEAWMERDGKGVLAAHDGVAFVTAGKLGAKDTALWPHEGALEIDGIPLRYIVVPSEGDAKVGIGAHEFGHLLGLGDKYEVGRWCVLGTGYEKPALCGFCRHRLGWSPAPSVDPRREQALALQPGEVARILVTQDGKESLFLDAREKTLVVWHAGGGREIELVAVLGAKADRLTPWSDPGFRGTGTGARDVWITAVRLDEGVFRLTVGPTAALTQDEEKRKQIGKPLGK